MRRRQGSPTIAVAYVRVSTEDQDNGPEAQRAAIRTWAAAHTVEVVAWYEDRVSGAAPVEKRPALLEALTQLRIAGAGLLVAAKRDRVARDVVVAATVERLVQGCGANLVTADGVTREGTPEAELLRVILDAFAAYERAAIKARTKAGLAQVRSRGERYCGKPRFGESFVDVSVVDGHPVGGRVVPNPQEQAQVARAVELRERGFSVARIARTLEAEGHRCRSGRWHPTQVRRVLARAEAAQ